MKVHTAEAQFKCDNAEAIISGVCDHLEAEGFRVTRAQGGITRLALRWGECEMSVRGDDTTLRVFAPSETGVAVVQEVVSSHLIEESAALSRRIIWSDKRSEAYPSWFCLCTVVETRRLTPRMQRITFRGDNLERYDSVDDLHMRLMFPLTGEAAPQWPVIGANGITRYPPEDVLAIRKYTFRRIDVTAGTFVVDFVLHEDAGPGARFAAAAKPGDVIGLGGPGGASAPLDRDWYLLAGDETALPAIARLLELLPQTARGVAILEVANENDILPLKARPDFEIRWLVRGERPTHEDGQLSSAVKNTPLPPPGTSIFVWSGSEYGAFREIRNYVRKDLGHGKHDSLVVSYWRKGP